MGCDVLGVYNLGLEGLTGQVASDRSLTLLWETKIEYYSVEYTVVSSSEEQASAVATNG